MKVNLEESALCGELSHNMSDHYAFNWLPNRTPALYKVIMFTLAKMLSYERTKDGTKVAVRYDDEKGNFKLGMAISYIPSDNGEEVSDEEGNFGIEISTDESMLEGIEKVITTNNDRFIYVTQDITDEVMSGKFKDMSLLNQTFTEAIDTLVKYLTANATEEGFELALRDVFTATAKIENGDVKITFSPGSITKQYIKKDTEK